MTKHKGLLKLLITSFLISSCADNFINSTKSTDANKFFGTTIINHSPSGTTVKDSTGFEYGFRSISVDFTNDSTANAYLKVNLPDNDMDLLPSADTKFKVFLLPDSITNENLYKNYDINMQILRSSLYKGTISPKLIRPNETYRLSLGFLFNKAAIDFRSEIFSQGHRLDLSIPKSSVSYPTKNTKTLNLLLGVTTNHGNKSLLRYITIPCGHLTYALDK